MPNGTVKWFNDTQGWGFIKQHGLAEDIFVHQKAIRTEGYRTLVRGDAVEYLIRKDHKGLRAADVSCPDRKPLTKEEFLQGQFQTTLPEPESANILKAKFDAARRGCGICGDAVKVVPGGDPFPGGPWIGRFLCIACWVLYWNDHPQDLADEEARQYMAEEARQVRLRRSGDLLFDHDGSRVFLTPRGTLVFDIQHTITGHGLEEYDPARFKALVKAILTVNGKIPGYEFALPGVVPTAVPA
jgi:CspA family cold shock protein